MKDQLSIEYYNPLSTSFIKAYLITMRPYLMFVSGITGTAGMSFSQNISANRMVMIFLASFLSYGFGQALTDCFQTDTDSISSPYRPLTQNLVSKTAILITSILGLAFCIGILSFYNPVNIILGAAAGTGLATYTFFKRRWWGGPFYNSWIVTVLFFIGYFASSNELVPGEMLPAAAAVFFGYSNFVLSGYFKDIEADRITGYNTLPVVYGRRISSIISSIFAAITIISAFLVIILHPVNSGSLIFFTAGIIFTVKAQYLLHKVSKDEEAYKAISPVVNGYILLISSIILTNKPEWIIPMIVFYFGYVIVLKIRPSKAQI